MYMPTCPCCSHNLLRHACAGRVYWFCRHCYQEMPTLITEDPVWIKSIACLSPSLVASCKKVSNSALMTKLV